MIMLDYIGQDLKVGDWMAEPIANPDGSASMKVVEIDEINYIYGLGKTVAYYREGGHLRGLHDDAVKILAPQGA